MSSTVHRVSLDEGNLKKYNPGQYFFLRFKESKLSNEAHPFSYSSWNGGDLQAYIKSSGDYTRQMHLLEVGDIGTVEGPYGQLFSEKMQQSGNPIICIAGGIGITPFLSILDWLVQQQSEREILLIWSVSYLEDLFLLDRLTSYQSLLKKFNYRIRVTKEKTIDFEYGRITEQSLSNYITKEAKKQGTFLICGPYDMVESTHEMLESYGIAKEKICSEKYSY